MKTPALEIPPAYLSCSDGKWRLVNQGLPLCADTTREQAEACAKSFRLALPAVYWDGDTGAFVPSV